MKRFCIPVAAVMILLAGSSIGQAAIIFSEDFEGVAVGTYGTSQVFGGFTVTSGTIDIVGPGFFPALCVAPESGHCVDLDGGSQGAMQTTNTFTLTPGNVYTLVFDLNGSQRGVATSSTVTFGSVFTHTYAQNSADTSTVTVSGLTVSTPTVVALSFVSNTPGTEGSLVDNVSIDQTAAVGGAPEPGSLALLFGAIPVALALRKRLIS